MTTNTKRYRLGIDCRLSGSEHAGIGRYCENLLRETIKINQEKNLFHLVLFFRNLNQAKAVLGQDYYQKTEKYHLSIQLINIRHYSLKEQFCLPKIYRQAKLDLLHVPHFNIPIFYRQNLVITIHDLLWHQQKGMKVTTLKPIAYYAKYLAYLMVVKQAIKQAKFILVPAQTIKETVVKYYRHAQDKIVVTKEGIAEAYQKNLNLVSAKSLGKKRIKKQLVYTGSLYPHKNIILIIKALKKLPKYQLLVVGSRNVFQTQVRKLVARYKVKRQVKFLAYVPDDKLIKLYQESIALVQPSLSEGFGLTGIEAMASGTAVLASDIPIFHEIYQDHAFYFNPKDSNSFLAALEKLEFSKREPIIKNNLDFAKKYRWQDMANLTCRVYLTILQSK
ncbi:MAG: glycosyltransferase family 4 protein [Candidatus Pacebacteria bacterium]|jgi:glycosyltransferase involved in cell wall biosynthesis|nr:glycosyltransferase family 4 protein [Candidatus Paceibacterota bacterium]